MKSWVSYAVPAALLAFYLWQFGTRARRLGGWKAVRETGGLWFLALVVAGLGGMTYLAPKEPGTLPREAAVLFSLGSLAAIGTGLYGLFIKLQTGQFERFMAQFAALRSEGHLADDPGVPLRAVAAGELERLHSRIKEAQVALRGVPDYRLPKIGNAPDIIERDLARIDEALDLLSLESAQGRRELR